MRRATVLGTCSAAEARPRLTAIWPAGWEQHAVELLRDGISGCAVGIRDNHVISEPYENVIGRKRTLNADVIRLK